MDYAAWKLFVDAAELGSLSKVALAYGTSQPHISRQISELEQDCGGRLFQRTGRGVVLTELGQRIAPKVRAWLARAISLPTRCVLRPARRSARYASAPCHRRRIR
jgi:DNA-binding transcriptional LysR family regulator